ncbi:PadR family transcriptional regulator [Herbiconiux sp. P16]|uniref:PadR family transcriptional regulator n=1 Tax=Herbiconiux wuyangfengii TaxID=3342794 RepID=UPI0035B91115
MVEAGGAQSGKFEQDLRKGVLVLATLSQLTTEQYGYSLRQALAERGLPIEEGTLYPLLRRLEGQGLLASEWRVDEGPPRRYYELSAQGAEVYRELAAAWGSLTTVMGRLLNAEGAGAATAVEPTATAAAAAATTTTAASTTAAATATTAERGGSR